MMSIYILSHNRCLFLLLVASVVNSVGNGTLDLLGKSLLQGLRDLAVADGVADFAGLLVGTGVVDGVGEFVLELCGSLWRKKEVSREDREGNEKSGE